MKKILLLSAVSLCIVILFLISGNYLKNEKSGRPAALLPSTQTAETTKKTEKDAVKSAIAEKDHAKKTSGQKETSVRTGRGKLTHTAKASYVHKVDTSSYMSMEALAVTDGGRSESEILDVLNRHKKGFEFIYSDEMRKIPHFTGRTVVKFVVNQAGLVKKAEVVYSDIDNRQFLARITGLLKSIRFSTGSAGDATIRLPISFRLS